MLTLERLSKTYADGTHALADITLDVRESEIVGLIGGSGCGKTTLLRLLAGLDRASAGAIRLDGEVISEPHPAIGIVFQEPRLLPWHTAADNVGFGLMDRPAAERRARVAHALEKVGLAEHANRWPKDLSGGQQQRVAIARALVTNPSIVLADEPTGNLDTRTSIEVMGIFQRLNRERGITVLVITHEHDIAEYGDRVIACRDGLVVSDVPVARRRDAEDELKMLPEQVVV